MEQRKFTLKWALVWDHSSRPYEAWVCDTFVPVTLTSIVPIENWQLQISDTGPVNPEADSDVAGAGEVDHDGHHQVGVNHPHHFRRNHSRTLPNVQVTLGRLIVENHIDYVINDEIVQVVLSTLSIYQTTEASTTLELKLQFPILRWFGAE